MTVRIGIGGPVGSGKTRLTERLLPLLRAKGPHPRRDARLFVT